MGTMRKTLTTEKGKKTCLKSEWPAVPLRAVLPGLALIWTLLLFPQMGWPTDEANPDRATTIKASEPAAVRSLPGNEFHDNKKGEVKVSVQSLDDVMKVMTSSVPERLEANVQPVTAEQAEKYGLRPNQGVIIIWLDPKGPLGRAGLATSDIILQVDSQPIESLESFIALVNSLGPLQPATFSVFDHRTGRIRNVRIVVRTEHPVQEARGNFLTRHLGSALAAIQRTAQSVQQQVGYAADTGKEAVTSAIHRVKKWVGMAGEAPVAAVKKGEEVPAKPARPVGKQAGGPG